MKKLNLRPADGFKVADPATGKPLPEKGAAVQDSVYWRRRLRTGVVIELSPEAKKPEAPYLTPTNADE